MFTHYIVVFSVNMTANSSQNFREEIKKLKFTQVIEKGEVNGALNHITKRYHSGCTYINLTAVATVHIGRGGKIGLFWDVMPCNLVEVLPPSF